MSRIFNCLLLIIGMACTISGLILMPRMPVAACVAFAMGIPAFILGIIRDNRRSEQIKSAYQAQVAYRVAQLTQRPWTPHQSLVITGNNFNILAISILCMGFCLFAIYDIYTSFPANWIILTGIVIIFPITLFSTARSISLLGKPIYTLSKNAITTPIYGKIEWQYIEKIYLQITDNKLKQRSGLLTLHLSEKFKILKNTHWTDRILALFGLGAISHKKIKILLNQSSEAPQTIAETANFLWCQTTKNTYHTESILLDKSDKTDKHIATLLKNNRISKKATEITKDSLKRFDLDIEQPCTRLDRIRFQEETKIIEKTGRITKNNSETINAYIEKLRASLDTIEILKKEAISKKIEGITEDDSKEIDSYMERLRANLNTVCIEKDRPTQEKQAGSIFNHKHINVILRIVSAIIYILFFSLFVILFSINFSLII